VFRALIACKSQDSYEHRYHGHLGFALKDQRQPEWMEAEAELTEAIRIRDGLRERGWVYYELNRAICRIALACKSPTKGKSSPEEKERIVNDLRVLAQTVDRAVIEPMVTQGDPAVTDCITSWLKANDVNLQALAPASL
jgi:hypothetical protein